MPLAACAHSFKVALTRWVLSCLKLFNNEAGSKSPFILDVYPTESRCYFRFSPVNKVEAVWPNLVREFKPFSQVILQDYGADWAKLCAEDRALKSTASAKHRPWSMQQQQQHTHSEVRHGATTPSLQQCGSIRRWKQIQLQNEGHIDLLSA